MSWQSLLVKNCRDREVGGIIQDFTPYEQQTWDLESRQPGLEATPQLPAHPGWWSHSQLWGSPQWQPAPVRATHPRPSVKVNHLQRHLMKEQSLGQCRTVHPSNILRTRNDASDGKVTDPG